jgi:hypothetical protein
VVPAWSVALAFAAGLALGAVACRIVMGRGRPAEPAGAEAVTRPVPTAPEPAPEAAVAAVAEPEAQPAVAVSAPGPTADQTAESDDPAAAVDDVVAELERRVKGRRTEG